MDKNVDEYIEKQKSPQKVVLKKIRKIVMESCPSADEGMIYGVPGFKLNGKNILLYAGFKEHIGIYPEPVAIMVFKKELKEYKISKGTIRFPIDKPIPYDLIKKIVKYKLK